MRCITPLKLKILKILNFSTIISIENCRPLATKLRDLKMFKMAFQVVFSAKNVPRFSFGLLVAPKLKKQGGAIMASPRAITSFQRPGQIGLSLSIFKVFKTPSPSAHSKSLYPRLWTRHTARNRFYM